MTQDKLENNLIFQISTELWYILDQIANTMSEQKKVTGVGGIFFKTKDAEKLKTWYQKHLGIKSDNYGAGFKFRQYEDKEKSGYLQWSPFAEDTDYFSPSEKPFMINYRVQNIESLVKELKAAGVTICDEIVSYDYGKFVHIMDLEGNKIELWEPVDEVFDKYYEDDNTREANY